MSTSTDASPPMGCDGCAAGSRSIFSRTSHRLEEERGVLAAAGQQGAEVDLATSVRLKWLPLSASEQTDAERLGIPPLSAIPEQSPTFGPSLHPATPKTKPTQYTAILGYRVVNVTDRDLIKPEDLGTGASSVHIVDGENGRPSGVFAVAAKAVTQLADLADFYIDVSAVTPGVEYGASAIPTLIYIPAANNGKGMTHSSGAGQWESGAAKVLKQAWKIRICRERHIRRCAKRCRVLLPRRQPGRSRRRRNLVSTRRQDGTNRRFCRQRWGPVGRRTGGRQYPYGKHFRGQSASRRRLAE